MSKISLVDKLGVRSFYCPEIAAEAVGKEELEFIFQQSPIVYGNLKEGFHKNIYSCEPTHTAILINIEEYKCQHIPKTPFDQDIMNFETYEPICARCNKKLVMKWDVSK